MTDAGPTPAADLGAVVAALSYDDLPVSVVRAAERRFADTVGVALAGAAEGAGALATETFATLSTGPATLLGGGSAAVHDAAFVNGVAGHCLDYDDVLAAIHVHPSVVVVPAVLAVAEAQDLDGPDARVVDGTIEQLAAIADRRHLVADALGEVQTLLPVGAALTRRRPAVVDELRPGRRESVADERDV